MPVFWAFRAWLVGVGPPKALFLRKGCAAGDLGKASWDGRPDTEAKRRLVGPETRKSNAKPGIGGSP